MHFSINVGEFIWPKPGGLKFGDTLEIHNPVLGSSNFYIWTKGRGWKRQDKMHFSIKYGEGFIPKYKKGPVVGDTCDVIYASEKIRRWVKVPFSSGSGWKEIPFVPAEKTTNQIWAEAF